MNLKLNEWEREKKNASNQTQRNEGKRSEKENFQQDCISERVTLVLSFLFVTIWMLQQFSHDFMTDIKVQCIANEHESARIN